MKYWATNKQQNFSYKTKKQTNILRYFHIEIFKNRSYQFDNIWVKYLDKHYNFYILSLIEFYSTIYNFLSIMMKPMFQPKHTGSQGKSSLLFNFFFKYAPTTSFYVYICCTCVPVNLNKKNIYKVKKHFTLSLSYTLGTIRTNL